jgi:Holliday junction DNA helicase RuvA
MIGKLQGKPEDLKVNSLIINVNGVGYSVVISFSTYESILNLEEVALYIHTIHKEDQFKLYGFFTLEEKEIFALLLGVSGIGPSMALAILSGLSIGELINVIKESDILRLTKIPGIGKSKAEKLLFELNRKVKKIEEFNASPIKSVSLRNEAVEALVSLGFDEKKSCLMIDEIRKENPDAAIEFIIKSALRKL